MKRISLLLLAATTFAAMACGNVYSGLANKTSDDAVYEEVLKSVDSRNWNQALAQLASLSPSRQAERDVIETWAGALAGQCGLDFITYFNNLSSASLTGSTIFKYLMNAFTQVAVNPGSCQLAQLKMEEISVNPAQRTQGENLFIAVLGMVKIGTYLRSDADKDGVGGLGDGAVDAGYNSCNVPSISDADVTQVVTGVGLVSTNLTALTNVIPASAVGAALSNISTACGATCAKTDASTVTAPDIKLVRDILRTGPSTANASYQLGIDDVCNPVDGPTLAACCP